MTESRRRPRPSAEFLTAPGPCWRALELVRRRGRTVLGVADAFGIPLASARRLLANAERLEALARQRLAAPDITASELFEIEDQLERVRPLGQERPANVFERLVAAALKEQETDE